MTQEVSWPGWDVIERIGRGSFGSVYKIQRNILGNIENAALKVISIPQNPSEAEELRLMGYDDASITERFKGYLENIVREYSLMSKLKGNTNIVYCDDIRYVPNDGLGWTIYIKMELLTPLMQALHLVQTEAQVIKLGRDLCSALELCRKQNIVHRDVKPQNIFMSDSGDFKLGDFGVAKTLERTSGGTRIGTFKYMVPEIYNGQPYGHSSDIYSLGMVLYWLLNEKRSPFLPLPPTLPTASMEDEALMRRFRGEAIPAPLHGSAELKRIVLKACSFHPKKRYASAGEMLKELEALQAAASNRKFPPVMPKNIPAPAPTEVLNPPKTEVLSPPPTEVLSYSQTEVLQENISSWDSTETPAPTKPKKTKKKVWLWAAICALVVVVVSVSLWFLITKNNADGAEKSLQQDTPFGETVYHAENDTTRPTTAIAFVPSVIGAERDAAINVLNESGFQSSVREAYSEDVAKGCVISQSPESNVAVPKGSTVTLTVSKGPAPGSTIAPNPEVFELDAVGIQLTARGDQCKIYSGNIDPSLITWHSNSPEVATVNNGVVKAVSQGTACIRAEYAGQKVTCVVTCAWDFSLKVNGRVSRYGDQFNADVSLDVGGSFKLTIEDDEGNVQNVVWEISDKSCVTVDGNTVKCIAKSPDGGVQISATIGRKRYICNVRIR